ncbi:hypothetical protein [Chryseobacterium sp.]|uniref:hypothetical protein n=1 Tax=Chryseobacterium sp. TaxID=1871047 RepID=UPI0028A1A842|nr:hypothetical protein [Chryseobacterium sp.]
MLSIFILIGAYRYYAQLAEKFGKTKWHYGLLAIGIYLGTQVILGLSYGIYMAATDPESLDSVNYTGFSAANMVSLLISVVAVWGSYQFLERKFKKENLLKPSVEINKIGKTLIDKD